MSKAAELAALIGGTSGSSLSNRNLIINGAMQVAQRGTSESSVTTGGYKQAPDRFKFEITSAGTWTISQSTTAPEGFSNSYKIDCTAADASLAAGDLIVFQHFIEGQNLQQLKKGTGNAENITLSFWVRSAKTGTYVVEIADTDNTRHIGTTYTISSADTWEYKKLTFAGDTSGALDNDNAKSLELNWWLAAGSTFSGGTLPASWASQVTANRAAGVLNLADNTANEWYITGVQLEVGEQATPFEHRSYADELLRCQRYYQKSYDDKTAPGTVTIAGGMITRVPNTDTYLVQLIRRNIVTMRATPSVVSYSTSTGAADKVRVSAADFTVAGIFDAGQNSTGFPQVSGNPSAGDDVRWQFTLDAEL